MAKAKTGPGRAQRKGTSAGGRATARGGGGRGQVAAGSPRAGARIGRYTPAEESGRYTPPVPRAVRRSSPIFGAAILLLLIVGVLMILLNYLTVLPGAVSVWYLIAGLVIIFGGFLLATRYR
jgi:hypothetical protein